MALKSSLGGGRILELNFPVDMVLYFQNFPADTGMVTLAGTQTNETGILPCFKFCQYLKLF
jgi:hypothetical protein